MSVFVSLGVLILVVLIQFLMQGASGIFAVFYHHAIGKYSKNKADILSLFFMFGIMAMTSMIFFALAPFMINSILINWILVGIMFALSLASLCFYFRKNSHGTELFISRKIAKNLILMAKKVRNISDAFALGVVSVIVELLFTLPLYALIMIEANSFANVISKSGLLLIDIYATLIPLLIIQILFKNDINLAEIQRSRVKNKNAHRITISLSYALLGAIIMIFRILT